MKSPLIVSGPHGGPALCHRDLVWLAAGSAPNVHAPITVGSWLIQHATEGLRALKSGEDLVAYQVDGIMCEDGLTNKRNEYLTAEEANSGNYALAVFALGGCLLELAEDGDGGNISDADLAAGKVFADVAIGTIGDWGEAEKNELGVGRAYASIKIDSSSINAAAANKLIQILGPAKPDGILGSGPRSFTCQIIAAAAQAQQP